MFPKSSAVEVDSTLAEPVQTTLAAGETASTELVGEEDVGEGEGGEGGGWQAKRAKTERAPLPEVHVVTKEDVESLTFKLTDVVLPMPG